MLRTGGPWLLRLVAINLVAAWRHATVFTAAERAALALAEEATRIADTSDGTWTEVHEYYDDDQVAALMGTVSMINAANRLAVILEHQGGSYEPAVFDSLAS